MMRLRQLLGIFSVASFGILLAVLLVEIMGRMLHLAPVPLSASYQAVRELVGRFPEPYSYFWFNREDSERIWIQFNSASLRDVNHNYMIDEDITRIMFLGDSYTAGWQVPLGETYTGRLREWLAETGDYDFINAGFHGWGTDREYLYYRSEGYHYNSDVVVLQIYLGNDIVDNGVTVIRERQLPDGRIIPRTFMEGNRPYFALGSQGELRFTPPDWLPPTRIEQVKGLRSFFRYYSFTFALLEQLVAGITVKPQSTPAEDLFDTTMPLDYYAFSPQSLTDDDWQRAWSITQQLIRQLREEVESRGGRFMVLLVDARWQHDLVGFETLREARNVPADWQPGQWSNRVRDFLDTENIPYLTPIDALLVYHETTGEPIIFEIDGHWTVYGHCVVAVQLYNWFIEQGLVSSSIHSRDALTDCQT